MKIKSLLLSSALMIMGVAPGYAVQAQGAGMSLAAMDEATVSVAETTGKAVVSISAEHVTRVPAVQRYYYNGPGGNDEALRSFLDQYFGQMPEREFRQSGLGSGVIIDARGYILTNQHVVENADKLTVILSDGRQFAGEVKGADPRSDLAVIKIDAPKLPVATLGDSDNIKIGQWVVAIGNPFGFAMQNPEPTVTVGVVSALHRTLGNALSRDKDYNDLIQTDAAINPGNSGGPLVDLKGDVIGINVAIFSTTGGSQGIGFAIPVNSAKRIISRLIEGKKISYGWIGVSVQEVTDDLAEYFGLTSKGGVLIAHVLPGSPGDKGGFKEGDIITSFDNQAVESVKALLQMVGRSDIGKKVPVVALRDKKTVNLTIEIGVRGQEEEADAAGNAPVEAAAAWRGMRVEDLTPDIMRRFNLKDERGVVVVAVEPGSPADLAGITPGDVVGQINRLPVTGSADYKKIIGNIRGDALLGVSRGYVILKENSEKSKQ
ncbi:MAG: Do family serine endopeptidase [Candidatus Omnitrophota bacterium]